MIKLLTLLFTILMTVASIGGYLYLTAKINAGETQIAEGQEQLAAGRAELKRGRARLAEGKKELAPGKKRFKQSKRDVVKDLLLGGGRDKESSDAEQLRELVQGGRNYKDAKERIAKGERQIAEGKRKIEEGERQLAAGEQDLGQGKEELKLPKRARLASVFAAVLFGSLSIVLGLLWRRSLFSSDH